MTFSSSFFLSTISMLLQHEYIRALQIIIIIGIQDVLYICYPPLPNDVFPTKCVTKVFSGALLMALYFCYSPLSHGVSTARCVTSVFTGMTLVVLLISYLSLSPGVLPARYEKWMFCDILDVLCLCDSFLTPSVWPAGCVTGVFNGSTQGALYLCYPALGKLNKA